MAGWCWNLMQNPIVSRLCLSSNYFCGSDDELQLHFFPNTLALAQGGLTSIRVSNFLGYVLGGQQVSSIQ